VRRRLTLLHTNDIHAGFSSGPATWRPDKAPIGGFEMLDAAVRRIRAERPNTLLVDAGDVMTGNPISQVAIDDVRGWALFDLMNLVGYDAWTIGNHDFDAGQDNLFKVLPRLKFLTVCSNLETPAHAPISKNVLSSAILSAGDVKVGIVGLMTPELPRVVSKSAIRDISVVAPVDALREKVKALEPVTDLVVVLSHSGETVDRQVAEALPEIDVIIGGHTHQRINPPIRVGKTLIVQAGSGLQNLGRLDLEVQDHEVKSDVAQLIPLWVTPEAKASEPVHAAVARSQDTVNADFQRKVGEIVAPWSREYFAESNLGNWITDQMRLRAGADVAFLNSGGIRKDLPAGPVSKGDLMSILPFDGQLCTFRVTGAQLRQILQADASAAVTKSHGILQVSGLTYSWRRKGDAAEVVDVTVDGKKLEPERSYLIATSDFLLFSQPEKYFVGVEPQEPIRLGLAMVDVVVAGLEGAQKVESRLEGRIVELPAGK
jgi:2',3'-cyclic-nucleotide 2'-phosphodiesterase (5'-nucleotidase family)